MPSGSVPNALAALEDMHQAWREYGMILPNALRHLLWRMLCRRRAYGQRAGQGYCGPHAMSGLHGAVEAETLGFKRPPFPAHLTSVLERYQKTYLLTSLPMRVISRITGVIYVPAPRGASVLHRGVDLGENIHGNKRRIAGSTSHPPQSGISTTFRLRSARTSRNA